MSSIDDNFYSNIQEERQRLGYSQQEIATICGVSRVMWGKYERGDSTPGGDALNAFMRAGADINFVFTGQRTPIAAKQDGAAYVNAELEIILNAYAHADENGRAALRAVANLITKK